MNDETTPPERNSTDPKPENLLKALGMVKADLNKMKALASVNGKIAGRRTDAKDMKPSKFCPACNKLHSPSGIVLDDSLKPKACEPCQAMFDKGMACLVSKDRRFAFCYGVEVTEKDIFENGGYAIIAGVSPEVMDKVEQTFQLQQRKQSENPDSSHSE